MKLIPLTKGKFAIVDDEDFGLMSNSKWSVMSAGYASRNPKKGEGGKMILMHRVILNAKSGQKVDHVSGNKLDNRRSNIRFATQQQNGFNRGLNINNKSGFKGVCWHQAAEKWRAYVSLNGRHIHLGLFVDKEEAINASRSAAEEHHGKFFHA